MVAERPVMTGGGLDMKISVHLVRAPPPTDQAKAIAIDAGTEQGHGAAGTGGAD